MKIFPEETTSTSALVASVNRSIGGCTVTDTSLGMSTTAVYTEFGFPTLVTVRLTVIGWANRLTMRDG